MLTADYADLLLRLGSSDTARPLALFVPPARLAYITAHRIEARDGPAEASGHRRLLVQV